MAKHTLFMLHGMGEHLDGWHDDAIKVLKDVFNDGEYEELVKLNFDNEFDCVPLSYGTCFSELREQWMNTPGQLKAALKQESVDGDASSHKAVEAAVDRIANAAHVDDSFWWTHAMDVVLYRFFSPVRERVKAMVGDAILKRITGANLGAGSWSILAHSLGTAVAYDTITALYAPRPSGKTLHVGDTRPKVICMIANVTRVLQRPGQTVLGPETIVRPGSTLTGAACEYYLNARNRLDPFVIPKPFKPNIWPDAFNANRKRYQHLRCGHVMMVNVHDLGHYLRNPAVHVPLFRALLGDDYVPEAHLTNAHMRFDSETFQGQVGAIRARLEDGLPSESADWTALLTAVRNLRKLSKEFGENA